MPRSFQIALVKYACQIDLTRSDGKDNLTSLRSTVLPYVVPGSTSSLNTVKKTGSGLVSLLWPPRRHQFILVPGTRY